MKPRLALRLQRVLDLTPEVAVNCANLINGTADPLELSPVTAAWAAQCYHPPSRHELVMEALNELIEGYGVEAIRGRFVDRFHQDAQAAYVNMGDSDIPTILLDHETSRYQITSCGDWVEAHERRRELL